MTRPSSSRALIPTYAEKLNSSGIASSLTLCGLATLRHLVSRNSARLSMLDFNLPSKAFAKYNTTRYFCPGLPQPPFHCRIPCYTGSCSKRMRSGSSSHRPNGPSRLYRQQPQLLPPRQLLAFTAPTNAPAPNNQGLDHSNLTLTTTHTQLLEAFG